MPEKPSYEELEQRVKGLEKEVSKRKGAREALRESEEKYRTILESIEDGYYEVDTAGNFTFFNDSLCKILGYSKDELLEMNNRHYSDKETAEKIYQVFNEVHTTGKPAKVFDWEIIRRDGARRHVETSVSLMKDAEGQRIGFRGIVRDISERKTLEIQLTQAQRLESIGQLAAGIAHEINTPTQYVGDNTRFFQDSFKDISQLLEKYAKLLKAIKLGAATDNVVRELEAAVKEANVDYLREEIPKAIQQSLEGLDRVAKIVQAMKEFSHPGTEEKRAIDINKAIESTITVTRNEWKYVADVEMDFDTTLPPVPCLPGEFNQVILNMIINAAHSIADVEGNDSEKKGAITVSTGRDNHWVEISISDTGSGIPEEIRSRIFDPFFTTKEVGRGTGQGLAISHSVIANRHGGKISFETEMGKGTTFIIRLPIGNEPE